MKQILFIRYRRPEKIDAGGEQCTNANYTVLCELYGEENVTVYYIHDSLNKKNFLLNISFVLYYLLKGFYYGLSTKKINEIIFIAKKHDYVFIDRSLFGVIAKKLTEQDYQGKIITFFHNVETIYFSAKIKKYLPWRNIVVKCADKNDRQACDYSDVIIALNKRDKNEIEKRYGRHVDIITPIVFQDSYKLPVYDEKQMTNSIPVCLFIGTYFPMNVNGILWFVKEVLPYINIRLQIVGKGMSAILPQIKENLPIEVFSDVPDLKDFIEQADFMLFPIFDGSGMKVKTCEALMYGKNIIGTTEAFEGYDLNCNKVGACCNSKEEFIKVFNEISNQSRPRFNAYSREMFVENYSIEQRKRKFADMFL